MKLKLRVQHNDQCKTKIDYASGIKTSKIDTLVAPLNPISLLQKEDHHVILPMKLMTSQTNLRNSSYA